MNNLYSYPQNDYRNYLQHYGVMGMHWGVRRYQNSDGSYTAEGKIRYNGGKNSMRVKENVAPEVVLALAYVVAPAVLMTVPYAADKADKVWNAHKVNVAVKKIKNQRIGEIDEKTGFHKRTDDKPIEEDLKNVNPAFNLKDPRTFNNCVRCSMAVESRRRGLDVMAQLAPQGTNGILATTQAFPKGKVKTVDPDNIFTNKEDLTRISWSEETKEKVIKQVVGARQGINKEYAQATIKSLAKEKNSRGSMFIQWGYGGGHAISYDVKDGKVRLIDGQTNKIYEGEQAERLLSYTWHNTSYKLNSAELNASEIKNWVM